MPPRRRHIAIDLGASSGRVLDVRVGGGSIHAAELHRFDHPLAQIDHAGGRRWTWNLDRILEGVAAGLVRAGRDGPADSIGIDSWAVDYGLLDGRGALVAPVAAYRDDRTASTFAELRARLGDGVIYARTGIQFQPFNTLYQLAADAIDPLRPLERAERMLMIPDLVAHRLCGNLLGERTNASTTQLLDVGTGAWITEFAAAAGVPERLLPAIADAGQAEPLGSLNAELARSTGLGTTPIVATASHDTAAAFAAAPIASADDVVVSSGTWSLVGFELQRAIVSDEARRANFTNERGAFGTFRFLRNVTGLWIVQECRRAWAEAGRPYSWEAIEAMAATASPSDRCIDVQHPRFAAPGDMPSRVREACREASIAEPEDDASMARRAFEGIAAATAAAIREAGRLQGRQAARVVVVGGGGANRLLNKLIADAAGLPVVVGPAECTAIGNALLQHAALEGIRSLDALRGLLPPPAARIDPSPRRPSLPPEPLP